MGTPVFSSQDYAQALQALMPLGRAWPRDADSLQAKVLASFAPSFQRSGQAGIDLLTNAFPATALDLLPEWEATLGLPDPCAGESPTLQGRRQQVVARFAGTGGQSIPFFINYAKLLGYTATIKQYSPFRCGQSHAGDPVAGQDWAFTWAIDIPLQNITYFRAGVSACGDALENLGNEVLECEMQAIKPAHSILQVQAIAFEDDLAVSQTLGGATAAGTIGKSVSETLNKTLGAASVSAALSNADRLSVSDTLGAGTVSAAVRKGTTETLSKTLGAGTVSAGVRKGTTETLSKTLAAGQVSAALSGSSGGSAPTIVSSVHCTPVAAGVYVSPPFTSGAFDAVAGNLILVAIAQGRASDRAITSVTDTAGNTYTKAPFKQQSATTNYGDRVLELWYCLSSAAKTGNVVTINNGGQSVNFFGARVLQLSGGTWTYDTGSGANAADAYVGSLATPAINTAGAGAVYVMGMGSSEGPASSWSFGSISHFYGGVSAPDDTTDDTGVDGVQLNNAATSNFSVTATFANCHPLLAQWSFVCTGGGSGGGGNQPPTADFSFGTSGLTANFTDASSDPDGTIAARLWDFGDGNTSTITNPSHTYAASGTYSVTLTFTDNSGAQNSVTHNVTVSSGGGGGNPDGTTDQPGMVVV